MFAANDAPLAKPNIVFLLIDDLGYADCGFNGGKEIRTPNIDKLAASGAVLESHYVQPVCSPTRAALMTGRYATRTGVYTVVRPHANWGLPLGERTLADALKEAGYTTAIVGKWHLGYFDPKYQPTSRGFEHQHGIFFGAIDHFTHIRDGSHDWHHDDKQLKEDGYSTHLITREACRLGDWKLVSHSIAATIETSNRAKKADGAKKAGAKKKTPPTSASVELYNLASDIGETANLADKEPERVATMQTRLAEFLRNAAPSGVPGGDTTE